MPVAHIKAGCKPWTPYQFLKFNNIFFQRFFVCPKTKSQLDDYYFRYLLLIQGLRFPIQLNLMIGILF